MNQDGSPTVSVGWTNGLTMTGDVAMRDISPQRHAQDQLRGTIDRAEKAAAALSEKVDGWLLPTEPEPDLEKALAQVQQAGSGATTWLREQTERLEAVCRRVEAITARLDV